MSRERESLYLDARAIVVPTKPIGEGPVRQQCLGCEEIVTSAHALLDCLQIFRTRMTEMQQTFVRREVPMPPRVWEPSRR